MRDRERCLFSVSYNANTAETASGRVARRRVGKQCNAWVGQEAMVRNDGIPICSAHMILYHEAVAEDAMRRQALRDKYDPGPLPL